MERTQLLLRLDRCQYKLESKIMRGGYRRIHTKPALTADQVREIEHKRLAGKLIKELAYEYQVGRNTLTRALNKKGAYA